MDRLLCIRCGDSIHPDTAARHAGQCVPCSRGGQGSTRERQEKRAKARAQERERRASPEWRYWSSLIDRVYHQPAGFEALPRGDQLYYLVNVLSGEVHNGGFDQFFSNTSGDRYAQTVSALEELGAHEIQGMLQEAKQCLFGEVDVPRSQTERHRLMASASEDGAVCMRAEAVLDRLDKRFQARADDVGELLTQLARQHGLYPVD